MRVFVVGSFPGHEAGQAQVAPPEFRPLFEAAEELGHALARREHTVLVATDYPSSIDFHVVQGMVRFVTEQEGRTSTIEINRPASAIFPNLPESLRVARGTYPLELSSPHKWIVAHVSALDRADVVITVGGGTTTRLVGLIASNRHKPAIAIASFGGSSVELYRRLELSYRDVLAAHELEHLVEPWRSSTSAAAVVNMVDILVARNRGAVRHQYFISYAWANSKEADQLEVLLRRRSRSVLRDEDSVRAGTRIGGAIESLVSQSDTVLALWCSDYSKSAWCMGELEYAWDRLSKGRIPHRVVLLMLDDEPAPLQFAGMLRVRAQSRELRELAVSRILNEEIAQLGRVIVDGEHV